MSDVWASDRSNAIDRFHIERSWLWLCTPSAKEQNSAARTRDQAHMHLVRRIRSDVSTALAFYSAGATLTSLLAFPVRRRRHNGCNVIGLKNGIRITTPREVELITLFQEIWADHCYTPKPLALTPEESIVDIGANVGVFTLWAAAHFPDTRIVAIEPSPQTFRVLRQNIATNDLDGRAELLQCACGGQAGTARLYSRGPDSMATLYQQDLLQSRFQPAGIVEVLTLDAVFERSAIQRCGLLKLDCEGAEYDILLNASEATLNRIRNIALEYHLGLNDQKPGELADYLRQNEFAVNVLPPRSLEDGLMYAYRMHP